MRFELSQTAFDIDGVVADVVTPFLRLLKERHGYGGFTPEDVTNFDLAATLGVPPEVVQGLIVELLERPAEVEARPYPGAAEVLAELCRREPLLFITSRVRVEPIREWFDQALPQLPPSRVQIIATGDYARKLDCLRDQNRVYFLDDHLETCRLLARAGLRPCVFDQPWNRADSGLPRVRGWEEVGRMFGLGADRF